MPNNSVSVDIERSCEEVFDLVHDYDRRLEWDTLLQTARVIDGSARAEKGVRTLCVGKWSTGGLPFETEYVSFERGKVAAVKLTNRPLFFREFAATIRHEPLGTHRSRVTYIYHFETHPPILSRLINPIIAAMLARETKVRLTALKHYLEKETTS